MSAWMLGCRRPLVQSHDGNERRADERRHKKEERRERSTNTDLDEAFVHLVVLEEADQLGALAKLGRLEHLVEPRLQGHVALVDVQRVQVAEDLLRREAVGHHRVAIDALQLWRGQRRQGLVHCRRRAPSP